MCYSPTLWDVSDLCLWDLHVLPVSARFSPCCRSVLQVFNGSAGFYPYSPSVCWVLSMFTMRIAGSLWVLPASAGFFSGSLFSSHTPKTSMWPWVQEKWVLKMDGLMEMIDIKNIVPTLYWQCWHVAFYRIKNNYIDCNCFFFLIFLLLIFFKHDFFYSLPGY